MFLPALHSWYHCTQDGLSVTHRSHFRARQQRKSSYKDWASSLIVYKKWETPNLSNELHIKSQILVHAFYITDYKGELLKCFFQLGTLILTDHNLKYLQIKDKSSARITGIQMIFIILCKTSQLFSLQRKSCLNIELKLTLLWQEPTQLLMLFPLF